MPIKTCKPIGCQSYGAFVAPNKSNAMTLMLSNEDVEQLLTMENCMEALEYAYGEIGRDQAVMGPVIRVISPVTESSAPRPDGRQLFYAYSAMAAAFRAGMLPPTGRILTCSITSPRRPACGSFAFQHLRESVIAALFCCTKYRLANSSPLFRTAFYKKPGSGGLPALPRISRPQRRRCAGRNWIRLAGIGAS